MSDNFANSNVSSKSKYASGKNSESSLYEKLQENKAAKQVEFYEESKAELSGRNLTDEDVKFLMSVEDAKREQELMIKNQTEAALHEFRIRHELLSRETQYKDAEKEKIEPIKISLSKISDKLKSSNQQTLPSESTIKSKRSLLGIAPKTNK